MIGKRVLITRPKPLKEVDKLTELLAESGFDIFHCPTIEIIPPDSFLLLDQALSELNLYDWIVFTSRHAVDAVVKRLNHLSIKVPTKLKTLAVGTTTAEVAKKAGFSITLTPEKFNAETTLQAISNYYQTELEGINFLFPRSSIGRETLVVGMSQLGASVKLVEAYRTEMPKTAQQEIERLLLPKASVDLVVFTSPSAVQNISELLAPRKVNEVLSKTLVACIGPVSVKAAKELGICVDICPSNSTAIDLAEAIREYFLKKL
ncbi:MAG: uroporphyrinogen-III synthase [Blastocatellia bacterium]|nr:uroporphyrinogen-III synthase [Blastocatellia bacterium]